MKRLNGVGAVGFSGQYSVIGVVKASHDTPAPLNKEDKMAQKSDKCNNRPKGSCMKCKLFRQFSENKNRLNDILNKLQVIKDDIDWELEYEKLHREVKE